MNPTANFTWERRGDTLRILDGVKLVAQVRRVRPGVFRYHSLQAHPPYREGLANSEQAALAHLGFKFVLTRRHL